MALDDQIQVQRHIDGLLERHLALLDRYTDLRGRLSRLHASAMQDIARANFEAQRGRRFGRDQYDGRMRASRRVVVGREPGGFCVVRVVGRDDDERGDEEDGDEGEEEEEEEEEEEDGREKRDGRKVDDETKEERKDDDDTADDETRNEKTKHDDTPKHNHDPLRWFGILAPPPLRSAQAHAVEAVEHVIPQLVSVAAEMQHLEIEVRRARKRRDKGRSKGPV
ncbi:hypothetical protein E4U42_004477 [Claviceps africana]|uniref:Vacuolar ATPase assembly protein VMA22 n=1 Tax=Claviceps africana TaxID=83212 RepID=A0A8K0JBA2_9HYPO|nr:hypothetical protein E4U42_004477 [Claviceps africana]